MPYKPHSRSASAFGAFARFGASDSFCRGTIGSHLIRAPQVNCSAWRRDEDFRRRMGTVSGPSFDTESHALSSSHVNIAVDSGSASLSKPRILITDEKDKDKRKSTGAGSVSPVDVRGLIVFEDNHVIVMNKPPCLLTQGDLTGNTNLLDATKAFLVIRDRKPGEAYLGADLILSELSIAMLSCVDCADIISCCNKLRRLIIFSDDIHVLTME